MWSRAGACGAALAFCTSISASAQVVSTGTPAADILLSRAIAEHRTFLTCSALDPATHAQIVANWQRDVTAAASILAANQVPAEAISAFTAAAAPEALLPAPDTPFEDLRQICDASPDWQERYFQLNLTILALKLPEVFE
jgi:hypothetical protein